MGGSAEAAKRGRGAGVPLFDSQVEQGAQTRQGNVVRGGTSEGQGETFMQLALTLRHCQFMSRQLFLRGEN